jgi:hypothetical protein
MKKKNKKTGWAFLAALLVLLAVGAYYSVSWTTDEMNSRITGEVTPDALYVQAAPSGTPPQRYQPLPNEGTPPGKPESGETPAATSAPSTVAEK